MECTFVVGQKVSCIRAPDPWRDYTGPEVGGVYTIRAVLPGNGGIGVYLVEITNEGGKSEPLLQPFLFRPVTDLLADFMIKRKCTKLFKRAKETQC